MPSSDDAVNIGALQQRVYGLESGQRSLADGLSNLSSRVETLFAGLATKIEDRSRPQYPLLISIGVFGLAVLTSVGWLAYNPIRETQADQKAAMLNLASAIQERVTFRELDVRAQRTQTDISRIIQDMNTLEQQTVPRGEHVERWRSYENQISNLQRQIDDGKKAFGDTYSLRDAFQSLQRRLDQIEMGQRKVP